MDRSSFIQGGTRYAGAAVVDLHSVIWVSTVPPETSAQRAELIILLQAIKLDKGVIANIYSDSRYAFATAHVHEAVYKERALLTAEGKTIKNKEEILASLTQWLPLKVAIIRCPGYQKGTSLKGAQGNRLADKAAREAAMRPMAPIQMAIVPQGSFLILIIPLKI